MNNNIARRDMAIWTAYLIMLTSLATYIQMRENVLKTPFCCASARLGSANNVTPIYRRPKNQAKG